MIKRTFGPSTTLIDVAHDIENRTQFPSRDGLLLSAFSFKKDEVFVIDNTSVDNSEVFTPDILQKCNFVCHNADHEARWGYATNFIPARYSCTLVNDRRLFAGQTGYRFDIVSLIIRWLGIENVPEAMNKDIRNTFHNATSFVAEQILYNASDVVRLLEVYYRQLEVAARQGRLFELNIRSRIIQELAAAEMTGIIHNSTKWRDIAEVRQKKADEICESLTKKAVEDYGVDPSVVNPNLKKAIEQKERGKAKREARLLKLKEQLERLQASNKTHLKSYGITLLTYEKLLHENETNDLQDIQVTINWGSPKQVIDLLRKIGCPLPTKKDKRSKGPKASLGKEARNSWFTNYEDSPFKTFMTQFDNYKKTIHNVKAFGPAWVEKYVRANGYLLLFLRGLNYRSPHLPYST